MLFHLQTSYFVQANKADLMTQVPMTLNQGQGQKSRSNFQGTTQ